MKFNLIINPAHDWQSAVENALCTCQAMLGAGHEVIGVFFYGDSVKIVENLLMQEQWASLENTQQIPLKLMLCSTMIENQELELKNNNSFSVVSMGSMVQNMELADKTVELN